jgi:hypothetical protein
VIAPLRRTHACRPVLVLAAALALTGCSGGSSDDGDAEDGAVTEERTAGGVPERWYDAVAEAVRDEPDVGTTALLDVRADCPLVDEVTIAGTAVEQSAAGVVRLGNRIPTAVCQFYPPVPVDLLVSQAEDEADYTELVESSGALRQVGNEQTDQEVEIGDLTVLVVRVEYPTNPAAGVAFRAHVFDDEALGRVTLEVADADDRDAGYDERAAAEDLVALLED